MQTAADHNVQIVTNDQYEDYREQFDIEERRVPFMIVQGEVELYWPQVRAKSE